MFETNYISHCNLFQYSFCCLDIFNLYYILFLYVYFLFTKLQQVWSAITKGKNTFPLKQKNTVIRVSFSLITVLLLLFDLNALPQINIPHVKLRMSALTDISFTERKQTALPATTVHTHRLAYADPHVVRELRFRPSDHPAGRNA